MKNALLTKTNLSMRSRPEGIDDGNWTTRALRKAGRDYDEAESQLEIAAAFVAKNTRTTEALTSGFGRASPTGVARRRSTHGTGKENQ